MNIKSLIGQTLKKAVPLRIYKLIANGAILVPSYYKGIIRDAERNFDLSLEDSDEKTLSLMRKYAHILDKGLHRRDISPGHSKNYYNLLKEAVSRLEKTSYREDTTLLWAKGKLKAYEELQNGLLEKPLQGKKPEVPVSFQEFETLVKARRSNRDFSNRTVSDEDVYKLKSIANWASSSCNKQPIHIYVANDFHLAKQCLACCKGGTGFSSTIPSFWVFTAEVTGYVWPSEIFLPVVDTCLGIQNVMLGATTLGLSGTLLSWAQKSDEEEHTLRKLLDIPEHHQIILCAVMGYAQTEFMVPERKKA